MHLHRHSNSIYVTVGMDVERDHLLPSFAKALASKHARYWKKNTSTVTGLSLFICDRCLRLLRDWIETQKYITFHTKTKYTLFWSKIFARKKSFKTTAAESFPSLIGRKTLICGSCSNKNCSSVFSLFQTTCLRSIKSLAGALKLLTCA